MEEKIIAKIKYLLDYDNSDTRGICILLNELAHLHIDAEIKNSEILTEFQKLFPYALSLLDHPNEYVSADAVNIVTVMKQDAPIVIPKLIEMLENSRNERLNVLHGAVLRALASYGMNAKDSLPFLLGYLETSQSSSEAYSYAHAIASLGVYRNDIILAFEDARDRITCSIKSDDKSFKSVMNSFIRDMKRLSKKPSNLSSLNERQSYLFNLLLTRQLTLSPMQHKEFSHAQSSS